MSTIKFSFHLVMLTTLLFLASCVKDSTKSSPVPAGGNPEILNRLKAADITPASFPAKTESTIELSYSSVDNLKAESCSIIQPSHVSVTTPCACDAEGVCSVGVTGVLGYTGPGSFAYTVKAAGISSTTGKANFTITAAVGGNVPPTITSIADTTTSEDTATGNINFTIADEDSVVSCANVTGSSSNVSLVPNANIVISGSGTSCYVKLTPVANTTGNTDITLTLTDNGNPLPVETATRVFKLTVNAANDAPLISSIGAQVLLEDTPSSAISFTISDADSVVSCANVSGTSSNTAIISNANIVIGGSAPNCTVTLTSNLNTTGTANITLLLTDNGSPMPAKTASTTFSAIVAPSNDTPILSSVSSQTTAPATPKVVNITATDIDSTLTCLGNISATSSNTALVPNTNIIVSGTAPSCSLTITPATGQTGTTTITVTLTDSGTPMPAKTAVRTFSLTVNPVNQAPTISAITAKTTNEDTAITNINFTISDTDSAVYCSNVTASSGNTGLVSNANIVITGTSPNCMATITPTANQNGSTNITLTLTDNGTPMPGLSDSTTFTLTVNAVNDAPAMSAISNKTTDEDTATNAISFTITDSDSAVSCPLSVVGTSSNQSIVADNQIVIAGSAPTCTVTVTPVAEANGSATITLTLSDNGTPMPALTTIRTFTLTVTPVVDLSGTLSMTNLSGVASSYTGNTYARKIAFSGLTADESITSLEVCLGTASESCDISSWVEATGYTTSGSAPTVSMGGSYQMKSGVGGAQSFSLTPSCSSTTFYYYSVRVTNSSNRISNILSTPAWSFWEPSCLGSGTLSQWLDASEPSTITVATGVSSWNDKSGNSRAVTQATTNKQPVYSSTGLGTLPGVTFNGTSTSLGRAAFAYAQGSATFFTVLKAANANTKHVFCEGRSVTTNNHYSPLMTSTTGFLTAWVVNNAGANEINKPTYSTGFFDNTLRLIMAEDTGTTFYTYSNGVAQSQAATAYTRGTNTLDLYRLGTKLIKNVESAWFAGTIGEFFILNGTISATNRRKLEGYTAHKWGVSGNLPVGHVYSVSPP
jgi:Bacterial Ig domain